MRLLAAALARIFVAGACGDVEPGTIELRNESNSHVLWMTGSADTLDDNLRSNTSWVTTRPGKLGRKVVAAGAPPSWCDGDNISHFLLRPLDGQPLNGAAADINVTLADFDIVAQIGPGVCWGERDSVWSYGG